MPDARLFSAALLLALAVAASGCEEGQPADRPGEGGDPWSDIDPDRRENDGLRGGDGGVVGEPRRAARRLGISQLEQAVTKLLGVAWTGNGGRNEFTARAATLGVPDYIQVTREDRSITPIIAKYLDDMAGHVCGKAVKADSGRQDLTQRVLVRYPEEIDRNLRWLRLKLHGIYVAEDSKDGIARLRKLYDDVVVATESGDKGWEAVCVALLSAPEFLVY